MLPRLVTGRPTTNPSRPAHTGPHMSTFSTTSSSIGWCCILSPCCLAVFINSLARSSQGRRLVTNISKGTDIRPPGQTAKPILAWPKSTPRGAARKGFGATGRVKDVLNQLAPSTQHSRTGKARHLTHCLLIDWHSIMTWCLHRTNQQMLKNE